jgi:polar amino acid transport system ATP-binding protein
VGPLCDEITSALDPEPKGEVFGVLADLKRDEVTLILVRGDIALLLSFGRRVW